MKKARRRIEVNLEELDRVLDGAREAPYARVSTHDQQTMPLQIRAVREYAAKRLDRPCQ